MTMMKKLLIVASIALGLQLNSLAYFNATALKTEVTSILHFIDQLDNEETPQARKAVELLNKEFRAEDKYEPYWKRYTLEDVDVIDMARIIAMDLPADAKVTEILALFARQEFAKNLEIARRRKEKIEAIVSFGLFVAAFGGIGYLLHLEDVRRHDVTL
jgi:hypothetical protein